MRGIAARCTPSRFGVMGSAEGDGTWLCSVVRNGTSTGTTPADGGRAQARRSTDQLQG